MERPRLPEGEEIVTFVLLSNCGMTQWAWERLEFSQILEYYYAATVGKSMLGPCPFVKSYLSIYKCFVSRN